MRVVDIDTVIEKVKSRWCYGCADYGSHCKYCNVGHIIQEFDEIADKILTWKGEINERK